MIYLSCRVLRPGMTLARPIPSANPALPLLAAGTSLTPAAIDKINRIGIQGAYIENRNSDGVEPRDLVEPELKQELLTSIKNEFDNCLRKSAAVAAPDFRSISKMADSILMSLIDREKLLFQIIDLRDYDNYTCTHSLNVGILSVLIGMQLELPRASLSQLAMCGLLHDLGKLDVPLEIINKPGPLTEDEFEIMRNHPLNGVQRLRSNTMFPAMVVQGIRSHHEKIDGTGYPEHLTGEQIPLYGKIVAVADVFDAMSSKRPYREAWPADRIIDFMTSGSGTHFDPVVLQAFLQIAAAYPVGSVIRLSDGSAGIVTDNTPGLALRPEVRLIFPSALRGTVVDLAAVGFDITVCGTVTDPEELNALLTER